MNIEQFLNQYTPDAKEFVKIFLIFMNNIVDVNHVKDEYQILDSNGDVCFTSGIDITMFYFIYLLLNTNTDIGQILKDNNFNIEDYFIINESVKEEILFICNNYKNVSISKLEQCFNVNSWARVFLENYSKYDGDKNVSLERILVNILPTLNTILTKRSGISDLMESEVFSNVSSQIAKLANRKEIVKTLYMEDLPNDLSKALEQLVNKKNTSQMVVKDPGIGYGEELTSKKFLYNPLVGREKELRNLGALLMDDEKSVIIYGNPGVGKTTLVKGLAYNIQNGFLNSYLNQKRIYEVSASELVSGTKYRGDFEKRLLGIIEKLINKENSILFIDEIHTLMGLGSSMDSTNNDAANILKPYLGDGRLKIIGGTTTKEYRILESDKAFDRRFIGLEIKELSDEDLIRLLNCVINRYKETKYISFAYDEQVRNEIIKTLLQLSKAEYQIENKKLYNPDLAITLLRLGYDFALYDGKNSLDGDSLIEGVNLTRFINEEGKEYFKKRVLELTR